MTPTAATRRWLIDKSAAVRLNTTPDRGEWASRINRGLVHITAVSLLELGFSARSADDHRRLIHQPSIAAMPLENLTPAIEQRAIVVQSQLASAGQHRAPSVADLLIAATAEQAGLVLLHLDKDFELIANLTGQPTERLAQA
ncbi:PIN domain nuclease [Kribbella solani]|uniref:PIN domain nuclease n=1 Tax=Kribbella solani TaxID=236067 RepID=UPI0029B70B10|nr:PIN domain nuclease [Kribbella solani]MDX2969782.1 PIN domain nuclease [Kribbella solani]